MTAKYTFFSWLRRGISTHLDAAVTSTITNGRAEIDFKVLIKPNDNTNATISLDKKVGLYGPGDIIGINSHAIIKTEPRNWITNFEPNYLPYIEFYDEDFPWRYTPASASGEKLRPWLFLIVLEESEFTRKGNATNILPSIKLTPQGTKSLPPETETWAWAHVHLNDSLENNSLQDILQKNPDSACSRLVCPRKLKPNSSYHAFLIPSFETGRLAGLGRYNEVSTTDSQKPAWGDSIQTEFPIYYEWYFNTGNAGDFEYLVRQIEPKIVDPSAGKRKVFLNQDSYPKYNIDQGVEVEFDLEGALQVPPAEGALQVPPAVRKEFNNTELNDFSTNVAYFLNLGIFPDNLHTDIPVITPPIYGKWHILYNGALSNTGVLNSITNPLTWINELNLDPRNRAVAAFGTEVFRTKQEEYMKIAWEQIDAVNKANRLIRQTQFASKVSEKIFNKHIGAQEEMEFFNMTSPVHKEISIGNQTLYQESLTSSNAAITPSPTLRRVGNPSGTMMKRFSNTVHGTKTGFAKNLKLSNADLKAIKVNPKKNDSIEKKSIKIVDLKVADIFLPQVAEGLPAETISGVKNRLMDSVNNFRTQLSIVINNLPEPQVRPTLDLTNVKTEMVTSYNNFYSKNGFAKNLVNIKIDGSNKVIDYTIPVMAYPKIDLPMYEELRDMSLELFFPNIQLIPNNSFTLFETNNRFIESFMVGLNYEMGRELLWREYPTDQRGSYFRSFWNNNDSLKGIQSSLVVRDPAGDTSYDINEIAEWKSALGSNSNAAFKAGNHLVFAIRADLLKKYPRTVIYAAQASKNGNIITGFSHDKSRYPIFTAKVDPDITFVGFDLSLQEIKDKTDPWYFIIKERPGEVTFGLDENINSQPNNGAPTNFNNLTPNNLTWRHVLTGDIENLNYIKIADTSAQLNFRVLNNNSQNIWGVLNSNSQNIWDNDSANSANMAYIFYQQPVLIAIEATELLK